MGQYQVTCITRDRGDPDYRIDEVGIASGDIYPIDTVIRWIQSNEHQFWVVANGQSVWIGVRQHPTSGRYYLATEPDGYPLNNLGSLRECR
jgi:hypothetical protein